MSPAKAQANVPSLEALILEGGVSAGDEWIRVAPENLRAVLTALKADGYTAYGFITCVDHLPAEPRFELVYQLRDMTARRLIRVRTLLEGREPKAPSVTDIFAPANFDERETYDLFGIEFEGHPNLTRILLPDDWVGHPLRRDYPVGGEPVDFSEDHETWQTAPPEA